MRIIEYSNFKRIWNFKFRSCTITNQRLFPLTKVWKGVRKNFAGAIIGAGPISTECYLSDNEYLIQLLKGTIT